MWKELKKTDNLQFYADMINNTGCWLNQLNALSLKENMENKINCRYFFLEDLLFRIGLSFKYNNGTEKMTYVVFLILDCKKETYSKPLLLIAQKTKEILEEYHLDLFTEYDYKELEQYNESFKIGYENFLKIFKEQFELIGLKCEYNLSEIKVWL